MLNYPWNLFYVITFRHISHSGIGRTGLGVGLANAGSSSSGHRPVGAFLRPPTPSVVSIHLGGELQSGTSLDHKDSAVQPNPSMSSEESDASKLCSSVSLWHTYMYSTWRWKDNASSELFFLFFFSYKSCPRSKSGHRGWANCFGPIEHFHLDFQGSFSVVLFVQTIFLDEFHLSQFWQAPFWG